MLVDDDVLAINADGAEGTLFWVGRDSGVESPCWSAPPAGESRVPVTCLEKLELMLKPRT
jgi:hypothetical protein